MAAPESIVRGRNVVLPNRITPAAIHIRSGRIESVAPFDDVPPGATVHEAGDAFVLPGLVDAHVHMNEPGRTEWEGFETATRAALAGGVTTVVDMPLNSIPATTTLEALDAKRSAARGRVFCDVAFWGGAVPGNEAELPALAAAGVCGFKVFLVDSGVPEFAALGRPAALESAMRQLADLDCLLIAHAEAEGPIARAPKSVNPGSYAAYLASRPAGAEVEAVELLVSLAQKTGARVHVVHLSAADALPALEAAQAEGLPVTAETSPHYLCLSAEAIPDRATLFKCAPPIREAENRERLWQGLRAGTIGSVASDHSPSPPGGKHLESGDFVRAWGGIASLGLALPLLWQAAKERGHTARDLARWMAAEPARLCGLDARKGAIAPGRDADLVVFDPDASWTVTPERLFTRHKITPYLGQTLAGRVRATFLRGRRAYDGAGIDPAPGGALLERTRAAAERRP